MVIDLLWEPLFIFLTLFHDVFYDLANAGLLNGSLNTSQYQVFQTSKSSNGTTTITTSPLTQTSPRNSIGNVQPKPSPSNSTASFHQNQVPDKQAENIKHISPNSSSSVQNLSNGFPKSQHNNNTSNINISLQSLPNQHLLTQHQNISANNLISNTINHNANHQNSVVNLHNINKQTANQQTINQIANFRTANKIQFQNAQIFQNAQNQAANLQTVNLQAANLQTAKLQAANFQSANLQTTSYQSGSLQSPIAPTTNYQVQQSNSILTDNSEDKHVENTISPNPKSRRASSESSLQIAANQELAAKQKLAASNEALAIGDQTLQNNDIHPLSSLKQLTENQNPNTIKPMSVSSSSGTGLTSAPLKVKKEKREVKKKQVKPKAEKFVENAKTVVVDERMDILKYLKQETPEKVQDFLEPEDDSETELIVPVKSVSPEKQASGKQDQKEPSQLSASYKIDEQERNTPENTQKNTQTSKSDIKSSEKRNNTTKKSEKPEKPPKPEKGKPGRKKASTNNSKRKSAPAAESVSSEKASPVKKKKRHNSTSGADPNKVTGIKNTIESTERTDYQIDPGKFS